MLKWWSYLVISHLKTTWIIKKGKKKKIKFMVVDRDTGQENIKKLVKPGNSDTECSWMSFSPGSCQPVSGDRDFLRYRYFGREAALFQEYRKNSWDFKWYTMCLNDSMCWNRVLSSKIISCVFEGGIPYSARELFHTDRWAQHQMLVRWRGHSIGSRTAPLERVYVVDRQCCGPRVYPFVCVLVRPLRLRVGWSVWRTGALSWETGFWSPLLIQSKVVT